MFLKIAAKRFFFITYRRLMNVAEVNIMLMTSDIEKATIQNVLDGTSVVSTFRRLPV